MENAEIVRGHGGHPLPTICFIPRATVCPTPVERAFPTPPGGEYFQRFSKIPVLDGISLFCNTARNMRLASSSCIGSFGSMLYSSSMFFTSESVKRFLRKQNGEIPIGIRVLFDGGQEWSVTSPSFNNGQLPARG